MKRAFRGKTAIVTGGASGIGRALAEELVARGAYVVIADIDEAGASRTAAALGDATTAVALDVTKADAVEALVDRIDGERGLDLMFNNAGFAIVGDAGSLSINDWDRLVDVNIRGVMYGTHAAYRVMRKRRRGHIVNTASIAGLVPSPTFTAYAATKHAVVGLSTSLRIEAAEHGVSVSAVCPGVIETPLVDNAEKRGFGERLGRHNMRIKPYSVTACANDALDGVARDDGIILVTPGAKVLHRLYRHVPRVAFGLLRKGLERARRDAGGD